MFKLLCKLCKKEFYAKPSAIKKGWGIFCSSACQYESFKKGKFVKCEICSKEVWRQPKKLEHSKSQKFFCSKSHQTLWRNDFFSGDKHPNWKNGESIKHQDFLIKNNIKPFCRLCKNNDFRVLAVHHIDQNRINNKLENLTWLCSNCHHLVHNHGVKYGGRSVTVSH